ncbi:hypothetical protein IKG_06000 [Bacillus cereus VD200]|nr:hypothetical protein IKG_06000 [Bacillus cereus VD200]
MGYFKGKQFKQDIILVAVGYYCRFSLSYRDVSEILKERGISIHPTIIMRWVHGYGNLIYQMWKKKNKSAIHAWTIERLGISKSKNRNNTKITIFFQYYMLLSYI